MIPNGPEAEGWAIAHVAVEEARRLLGSRLASAYAIGSLAHGGFARAASDVDVALVTEDGPGVADEVAAIMTHTLRECASPLAARLSVFHAAWPLCGPPGPGSRFPAIDRLDLVEHGALMHGDDRREEAPAPAPDEIVDEAVRFSLERLDVASLCGLRLVADEVRKPTKLVLAPVRLLFLIDAARVGSNDDAADHYRSWPRAAHRALVEAALRWRVAGVIDDLERARALLAEHLAPLHAEVLTELAARADVPHAGALRALADEFATIGAHDVV